MAQFTVRVELHKATWSDYDILHAAMESKGFSRDITSSDGATYRLPWAEYTGFGSFTSAQIRDIAREAANTTGKQNAVLVTESNGCAWVGLNKAS